MAAIFSIQTIVAFFSSKLGRWSLGAIVIAAAYMGGDIRGRRIEHTKCVAAAAAAKVAAENIDRQARSEVVADSTTTVAELKAQKENADAQIAALQTELAARPIGAPCLYGVDGKPAGGVPDHRHSARHKRPAGPSGVPAAPTGYSPEGGR